MTIAQAIDESGWGQSYLFRKDHNLFGIKGSGPGGSDLQPTQEYENGQMVTRIASFRVYRSISQSIDDHGKLLATSPYYTQSMAQRHNANAFASALTGIYATDPGYGGKLITLMRAYDLYCYDRAAHARCGHGAARVPGTYSGAQRQDIDRVSRPNTRTPESALRTLASPGGSICDPPASSRPKAWLAPQSASEPEDYIQHSWPGTQLDHRRRAETDHEHWPWWRDIHRPPDIAHYLTLWLQADATCIDLRPPWVVAPWVQPTSCHAISCRIQLNAGRSRSESSAHQPCLA